MSLAQETSRQEVASKLKQILDSPEFKDERTIWHDLWDWFAANFDLGGAARLGDVLKGLLVGILLVTTVVYLVAWIRSTRRAGSDEESGRRTHRSPLEHARVLAEKARSARARGDERGAVRLYLHALIMSFSRQGGLAYRASWTNRELLLRGAPSPRVRDTLESLVLRFEPKEFGRDEVLAADLDLLEDLAQRELSRQGVSA